MGCCLQYIVWLSLKSSGQFYSKTFIICKFRQTFIKNSKTSEDLCIFFLYHQWLLSCKQLCALSRNTSFKTYPGACSIKHYGFVIYGKLTNFIISCVFYCHPQTDNLIINPHTHQLTTKSANYEGLILYCTGPRTHAATWMAETGC